MGAEVVETSNGYPNVVRARARARAAEIGNCVKWSVPQALADAAYQCKNIPKDTKRVIVPTGSGLTAAGVMAGLAQIGHTASVLAACVSNLATADGMTTLAKTVLQTLTNEKLPKLEIVRIKMPYGKWKAALLPDGSVLDPFYAAKAYQYVQEGDCLWLTGLRPLSALPDDCIMALDKLASQGKLV